MGSTRYTDEFGPNVQNILVHGSRVITGRVPAQVRKQLNAAVKAGVLGHAKKDGLLPEVYFHTDHKSSAMEMRARHADYAVKCIAGVMFEKSTEQKIEEALASLPSA